jgi:hypothetical protein
MTKSQQRYLSYLLRLWQTSDGRKQIWRASLESPASGERQGFASLKDLFDFLQTQTELKDEEICDQDAQGRG